MSVVFLWKTGTHKAFALLLIYLTEQFLGQVLSAWAPDSGNRDIPGEVLPEETPAPYKCF